MINDQHYKHAENKMDLRCLKVKACNANTKLNKIEKDLKNIKKDNLELEHTLNLLLAARAK